MRLWHILIPLVATLLLSGCATKGHLSSVETFNDISSEQAILTPPYETVFGTTKVTVTNMVPKAVAFAMATEASVWKQAGARAGVDTIREAMSCALGTYVSAKSLGLINEDFIGKRTADSAIRCGIGGLFDGAYFGLERAKTRIREKTENTLTCWVAQRDGRNPVCRVYLVGAEARTFREEVLKRP
jgi:hypothetical protein